MWMWRKFWDMNFSERNYKFYLNRAQVNGIPESDLEFARKYIIMEHKMWEHWCPVEHTILYVGKGEECNWCGQDKEYESRNRRYRNRFTTTNTDPLHSSKRSTDITSTSVGSQ